MINVFCSESKVLVCQVPCSGLEFDVFLGNDHPQSADDFFALFDIKIDSMPEKYGNISSLLGISSEKKMYIVPKDKLVEHRKKVVDLLDPLFSDTVNIEYFSSYIKCKQFLSSMVPAKIDLNTLNAVIDQQQHDGVKNNLSTFFPVSGRTMPIKYSMTSSSTGRLSVVKGPRVLTSPAAFKKSLRSEHPGGKVLQIDLKSAEPNFALFSQGRPTSDSIYDDIASKALSSSVDRDTAKLITLSALYGQSISNLRKQLPPNLGAEGVLRKVKQYFSYSDLLNNLTSMYNDGNFKNYLGRPLKTDKSRLLISHFLQSSVAEASILMFSDFCSQHPDCSPLFVIHDALIIDCKKEFADHIMSSNVSLEFKSGKFPVSVCEVG